MELGLPAVFALAVIAVVLGVVFVMDRLKIQALSRKFNSTFLSVDEYRHQASSNNPSQEVVCLRCLSTDQLKEAYWDEVVVARQWGTKGLDPEKYKLKLCGVCDAVLFRLN